MRGLLTLLTASTLGSGAFALTELRPLHQPAAEALVVAQPTTSPAEGPVEAVAPRPAWKPLPAPVPARVVAPVEIATNNDDIDSDDLADESDRCPTDSEDRDGREAEDDGCPEPITTDAEPAEVITLDPIDIQLTY